MNIKDAKQQIEYTVKSYLTRDEKGRFLIPVPRQRPVFLMGPPGIGKTAIMEQISQELGIGLVSYSMTHHTRQSAIGLPFIVDKTYGGVTYKVSEYTMSEIIASVYDMIEETGCKEGILFLDEVNCVSETLAPAMLQFLQYKIFGRHQVPDGWIVVTAGNPPEYNNSVREFDIVTWDRLKRIDVEPDYAVWKEYAYQKGVHPAIMTYLEVRRQDFYQVETTAAGKRFATARGWVDLSEIIGLYEKNDLPVDETLVAQYLQQPKIARDFAVYYDLFRKYQSDYQVDKILSGKVSDSVVQRASSAKFDERLALLGLLLDALFQEIRLQAGGERTERRMMDLMRGMRPQIAAADRAGSSDKAVGRMLDALVDEQQKQLKRGLQASSITREEADSIVDVIDILNELAARAKNGEIPDGTAAAGEIKKTIESLHKGNLKKADDLGKKLNNAYGFCEKAFSEDREILIFTTELTINRDSVQFIGRYDKKCEAYFRHSQELLIGSVNRDLAKKIDALNLKRDL